MSLDGACQYMWAQQWSGIDWLLPALQSNASNDLHLPRRPHLAL